MKKQLTPARAFIALLILFFLTLLGICGDVFCAPAYAASNVLTDLKRDEAFNVDAYHVNVKDYSIKIIQIAESEQGELLIYTYQPCGDARDLRACSINIAREMDNSAGLGFKNYPLTFLNSDGVFFKYKVEDFELRADAVRYYNISNILRPFDSLIDAAPGGGNTASEVPYEVGQFWTASTAGGDVTYTMIDSDVVTIQEKYVGIFEYNDGADVGWLTGKEHITHTMRNFVAFSTNRDMDRLYEVELQYCLNDISYDLCVNPVCLSSAHPYKTAYNIVRGKKRQQDPVTLDDREVTNNPHGIFGNTYKWKQIESTEEFISKSDSGNYQLTTEGATDIKNTQWVISFYDSVWTGDIQVSIFDNQLHIKGEQVSDVIILRLKFEKEGKTFNLGVVDNKQTGSGKPINEYKPQPIPTWVIILIIVVVLIAAILLAVFFPPVAKFFGRVFKRLAWLICAPFRLIAKAVQNRKEAAPAKTKTSKSSKRSKSKPRAKTKKKRR